MVMAADFIEQHFSHSLGYIGIHWKFNAADWIAGCDKLDGPKVQQCEILSKATHKDVAGAILGYAAEKFDKKKHSIEGIRQYGMYIAAGEHEYATDRIAAIAGKVMDNIGVDKAPFYTTSYLEKWIKFRYEQCSLTSTYLSEVISVVEHHILFESKVLLFMTGDPWSTRVMNDRKLVGRFMKPGDKSFVDVITNFITGQPAMKVNPMVKQELKKRLSEMKIKE